MALKIVSEKKYKVQVEILQEMIIDFSEAGTTKAEFEKLPFREKSKIIFKYGKVEDGAFKLTTDIEILSKIGE